MATPVEPAAPWTTVWPVVVAVLVGVLAAVRGRKHWWPLARRDKVWMAGLFAVALLVRLFVVPAWWRHTYDGHEAEYWDIFTGRRALSRGGTILYPSMQWLWWSLGRVLPHKPLVPVVVSVLVSSLAPVVLAAGVKRWMGLGAAVVAGLVVALHPTHAAWGSSAYNVAIPSTLICGVFWSTSVLSSQRVPAPVVAWMGGACAVLAVATRLETVLLCVPAGLVVLCVWPDGVPARRALRGRVGLLGPLAGSAVLAALCAWPLLFPGELPGSGERGLSLAINWSWLAPLAPLNHRWALLLLACAWVSATVAAGRAVSLWMLGAVLSHGVLCTFDDYGDRHALLMLPALAVTAGGLVDHPRGWPRWLGGALVIMLLAGCTAGLIDLRKRYYGSEEAFAAVLEDAPWSSLPRWSAAQAKLTENGGQCGWINEDPRVSPAPQRSHFNLLDPTEAASLRGDNGCLRWCLDLQDWRWSSRGVRDRALRTAHLYELRPVAVVEESSLGYACLLMELGPRTRATLGLHAAPGPTSPPSLLDDNGAAGRHPTLP